MTTNDFFVYFTPAYKLRFNQMGHCQDFKVYLAGLILLHFINIDQKILWADTTK